MSLTGWPLCLNNRWCLWLKHNIIIEQHKQRTTRDRERDEEQKMATLSKLHVIAISGNYDVIIVFVSWNQVSNQHFTSISKHRHLRASRTWTHTLDDYANTRVELDNDYDPIPLSEHIIIENKRRSQGNDLFYVKLTYHSNIFQFFSWSSI